MIDLMMYLLVMIGSQSPQESVYEFQSFMQTASILFPHLDEKHHPMLMLMMMLMCDSRVPLQNWGTMVGQVL